MAMPWPTLGDLESQLQTTFTGRKVAVAVAALEAATEWISTRVGIGPATVVEVYLGDVPTGGTFTLTYGGATTDAIAYDATGATVQAAFEALAGVGAGNVTVSARPGSLYTVTFAGDLALQDVANITATSLLTGLVAQTVTVSHRIRGSATVPAPIFQAILLYAAKFYQRQNSPDGVAGTAENGLIRTGRYDSDAESLLGPYVGIGVA